MKKEITGVLRYFSLFAYPPTFDEIYSFFPTKISKKILKNKLNTLIQENRLIEQGNRYTLGEYNNQQKSYKLQVTSYKKRYEISQAKIRKAQSFIRILSLFPQIRLIGLSGSIAMMNAKAEDDVDFFIITAKNRIWTGRFIGLSIAGALGLRRKRGEGHAPDKVCLNLFFDKKNLRIPLRKHNRYVGHEVLQMKPILNKNKTLELFLQANQWVFQLFPNAKSKNYDLRLKRYEVHKSKIINLKSLGDIVEYILKKMQLYLVKKHQTTEIITDSQLWFFPDDFEKKLPKTT